MFVVKKKGRNNIFQTTSNVVNSAIIEPVRKFLLNLYSICAEIIKQSQKFELIWRLNF